MSVLLLTYANNSEQPLDQLTEEEEKVYQSLRDLEEDGFSIERESNATPDKLIDRIRHFRERLILFSYSGHAGSRTLETQQSSAHARGLCGLLGECPHLRVVLLNGCSTKGQVESLLQAGVPVVIATHAPIDDSIAREFAVSFFKELKEGRSVEEAFKTAKHVAHTINDSIEFKVYRGLVTLSVAQSVWGLFQRDDSGSRWTLHQGKMTSSKAHILKEAAEKSPEALRVFVIGDQKTLYIYEKISASLSHERQQGKLALNDGWGREKAIHRETYLSELHHAQAVIFLVNDPDFNNFIDEYKWIKEYLEENGKPILLIRIDGAKQASINLAARLGHIQGDFPLADSFTLNQLLKLENASAVFTEWVYPFLIKKFEEIRRQKSIDPEFLAPALAEFDLLEQRNAFKSLLQHQEPCKFALFQGTERCGQNLLKTRLMNYLHHLDELARSRPWIVRFKSGLEIVDTPEKFWLRLAEELDMEDDDPGFICRLIYNRLKRSDAVLVLDEVFWPGIDEEAAARSADILKTFWSALNEHFPAGEQSSLGQLFIFGINRATDNNCDFNSLDLEDANPNCRSMVLPTLPMVEESFLSEWHLEQGGRRALNVPEFRSLLDHCDYILSDKYLENVITRIGQKLNCLEAVSKVLT